MTQHFQRELDHLKRELLELSVLVDDCVVKSINSLRNRDEALAREVIDNDDAVDNAEVALEEQCLKILALHQPVAGDLRFIIAALKINNELERTLISFFLKLLI